MFLYFTPRKFITKKLKNSHFLLFHGIYLKNILLLRGKIKIKPKSFDRSEIGQPDRF